MSTQLARPNRRRVIPALVVGVAIIAALVYWRTSASADAGSPGAAPYDDPRAAGAITLCSADGKPVTEGSVDDRPFAAVALGETGLPAELDPAGTVATLFAYQPREGVSASEFSGTAITAAGLQADPASPVVVVPDNAWSLGDFVAAYPADLDGYVQLRLFLGTPAAGTLTDHPYDTADLHIDGDRWELVTGGSASCASATQTSEEN
ncbi:hypothetical protein [Nocardioides sp. SR21]|uniref:hypothetical protein n=1 Tax=Nocardioides sp. SR21 TaxID=2919501 RepID=UPI001FAA78F4|nr:hypothetical protein [Nocardioides sp. SR21]